MARVSILMAMYNAEQMVSDAIGSCLVQTHSDWELLIVDDGSSDNSLQVAESFNDPRIRVSRHEKNLGPAAARNTAIEMSTGDWMTVLDADDAFRADRLEWLLHVAHTSPNRSLVIDSLANWVGTSRIPEAALLDVEATELRTMFDIDTATWVREYFFSKPFFSRTLLKENVRYRSSVGCEDLVFFLELCDSADHVIRLTDCQTYTYRLWPGSLVHRGRDQVLDALSAVDFSIERFSELPEVSGALLDRRKGFINDLFVQDLKALTHQRKIFAAAARALGSPCKMARLPLRWFQARQKRKER